MVVGDGGGTGVHSGGSTLVPGGYRRGPGWYSVALCQRLTRRRLGSNRRICRVWAGGGTFTMPSGPKCMAVS